MKRDPLQKAQRTAYAKSAQCELDRFTQCRSHWQRKATIARNKLKDVQRAMDSLLERLVKEKDGAQ